MRLFPLYSSTGLSICPTVPFSLKNNGGFNNARLKGNNNDVVKNVVKQGVNINKSRLQIWVFQAVTGLYGGCTLLTSRILNQT